MSPLLSKFTTTPSLHLLAYSFFYIKLYNICVPLSNADSGFAPSRGFVARRVGTGPKETHAPARLLYRCTARKVIPPWHTCRCVQKGYRYDTYSVPVGSFLPPVGGRQAVFKLRSMHIIYLVYCSTLRTTCAKDRATETRKVSEYSGDARGVKTDHGSICGLEADQCSAFSPFPFYPLLGKSQV